MTETDWNGAFDVRGWMCRNSFSERYELAVGCYTFELCLLWPYRNGSAIEVVRCGAGGGGEVVFFAGF